MQLKHINCLLNATEVSAIHFPKVAFSGGSFGPPAGNTREENTLRARQGTTSRTLVGPTPKNCPTSRTLENRSCICFRYLPKVLVGPRSIPEWQRQFLVTA